MVDPRTTSPLDAETILETVEETGRLVVRRRGASALRHGDRHRRAGGEKAFGSLRAPIKLVTAPHAPVPFSPALEDLYIPSVAKIEAAVAEVMDYGAKAAAE